MIHIYMKTYKIQKFTNKKQDLVQHGPPAEELHYAKIKLREFRCHMERSSGA